MRSTSVVLALGVVFTASGAASTCDDADGNSLLQVRKVIRVHEQTMKAHDLLRSMRAVANSFTAETAVTMTPDDVNAAIGTANTALQTMLPTFE